MTGSSAEASAAVSGALSGALSTAASPKVNTVLDTTAALFQFWRVHLVLPQSGEKRPVLGRHLGALSVVLLEASPEGEQSTAAFNTLSGYPAGALQHCIRLSLVRTWLQPETTPYHISQSD